MSGHNRLRILPHALSRFGDQRGSAAYALRRILSHSFGGQWGRARAKGNTVGGLPGVPGHMTSGRTVASGHNRLRFFPHPLSRFGDRRGSAACARSRILALRFSGPWGRAQHLFHDELPLRQFNLPRALRLAVDRVDLLDDDRIARLDAV